MSGYFGELCDSEDWWLIVSKVYQPYKCKWYIDILKCFLKGEQTL